MTDQRLPNRHLTLTDYGYQIRLAREHLQCLGHPWGNSWSRLGGTEQQWQAYDKACQEYQRSNTI